MSQKESAQKDAPVIEAAAHGPEAKPLVDMSLAERVARIERAIGLATPEELHALKEEK